MASLTTSKVIWLIEDSIGQLQDFKKNVFGKMGYAVEAFRGAEELLGKIDRLPVPVAVVMDLALPGSINGFQLAERILERRKDISPRRFCFVTGWKNQFQGIVPDQFKESVNMIDKANWTIETLRAGLARAMA